MRNCISGLLGALVLLAAAATACHAQFPEGAPMPISTVKKEELHTSFRFGYNANDSLYKYPGEYRADGNFLSNGHSALYGLADVLIESRIKGGEVFSPSRLWGTFEVGGRTTLAKNNYGDLFIRHQSAHDVDSVNLPDSMWEYVGGRFHHADGNYDYWVSAGYYTRRIYLNYSTDYEGRIEYRFGSLSGRPFVLAGDIHCVTENSGPRSGFVDYAIEPSLFVNKHVSIFVDYGLLHDEDAPNGKTAIPVIIGANVAM